MLSTFERAVLMVMALFVTVASMIFIYIAVVAYQAILEFSKNLEQINNMGAY